jgi:SAM-dependent methyltransferase
MRRLGFDARLHDITEGAGAFTGYDVAVAGELIEHLPAPQALIDFARDALVPGGLLIITTPNPFAPHRARAGQMGLVWENADHVVYAFPSGIAEMCERSGGMDLVWFASEHDRWIDRSRIRGVLASVKQFVTGSRAYRADPFFITPVEAVLRTVRPRDRTGETMVYVVSRSDRP